MMTCTVLPAHKELAGPQKRLQAEQSVLARLTWVLGCMLYLHVSRYQVLLPDVGLVVLMRLCASVQPYERPPKRTAAGAPKAGLPAQRTAHSHNSFADTVYDYMHNPPSQPPKPRT